MRCFKTEIEQMKIALIGYGKMGHAIEQIALQRGHEIVSVIDVNNQEDFTSDAFKSADVAIEFSMPAVAMDNYRRAFAAGVPVVSGTTGWLEHLPEIKEACKAGQTFFYASNFSLGVNIFFALNKYLAKIMNDFPAYDVRMVETHHVHKLDAPSGTAVMLFDSLNEARGGDLVPVYDRQSRREARNPHEVGMSSVRGGTMVGEHSVFFFGRDEVIEIRHQAFSRQVFATGALRSAKYLVDKLPGLYDMDDVIG